MKLPLTVKMLQDWGGPTTFRDGCSLFERGLVMEATVGEDQRIYGTISWGSRSIKTGARILPDHSCENQCPCRDNVERGVVCAHVIALGLALLARHRDPDRERKRLEEERHAHRVRQAAATEFFKRAPSGTPGAVNCALRLELPDGWREAAACGNIPVRLGLIIQGAFQPMTQVARETTLGLTPPDEAVLFVLEEIAGGALPDELSVSAADFINLLSLHTGRELHTAAGAKLPVNSTPVQSMLRVDLDHENGELLLTAHTELPFTRGAAIPTYVVAGRQGWVFGGGNFWPLARLLPVPLWELYVRQVVILRPDVPRFLREELPQIGRASCRERVYVLV